MANQIPGSASPEKRHRSLGSTVLAALVIFIAGWLLLHFLIHLAVFLASIVVVIVAIVAVIWALRILL